MSENSYLAINGRIDRSWLVPPDLAKLIRESCVDREQPYLIPPATADTTMYAVDAGGGDYTLHLGAPDFEEEPRPPTWGEYLAGKGVDISNPSEVKQWLADETDKEMGEIDMGSPIEDGTLEHWRFWDYDLFESPMAKAYRYLESLPLKKKSKKAPAEGVVLGDLDFVEGDRPGSNLTYVAAPDLATLACLQEWLKSLDQNVNIEIYQNA